MDTSILEDIGLTKGEITVYITLLEEGPRTAGKILEKAKIQNSVFHFNVNRLIEKGLVSYIKKGQVKIYQAANPDQFLYYLKDKESKISEILPILKQKQKLTNEKHEAEIFEGKKGLLTLLAKTIEDAKRGDEFLFFSPDFENMNEEILEFYRMQDAKRKSKGLKVRGIAHVKLRKFFKGKYADMRYIDFPVPANSAFCNDKMNLISWEDKPRGILITSKSIVKKQKEFFNALWNLGEK